MLELQSLKQYLNYESKIMQYLLSALKKNKLSQTLLFIGENYRDKFIISLALALYLSCNNIHDNYTNTPCKTCYSCRRIIANSHPNVNWIDLKNNEKHEKLGIELAKNINYELKSYPYEPGTKIFIITQADHLTNSAATSLLKVIEELLKNRYIIFFSTIEGMILPTIVSRCQKLFFPQFNTYNKKENIFAKNILYKIFNYSIKEKMNLIDKMQTNKNTAIKILDLISNTLITQIKETQEQIQPKKHFLTKVLYTRHQINKNINIRLALEDLILNT